MLEERSLFPFQDKNAWGYLTADGCIAHPAVFDFAMPFANGLSHVDVLGELHIIDSSFAVLGRLSRSRSYVPFSDGLLAIEDEITGQERYVDSSGGAVFSMEFDSAYSFSSGRAFVRVGQAWGMINRRGAWLIEPSLKWGTPFRPGEILTSVQRVNSEYCDIIDLSGNIVAATDYQKLRWVRDGLVPFGRIIDGSWRFGVADERGKEVVPATFAECEYGFSSNVLGVETDDGPWGLIDRDGAWAVEPQYNHIGQCSSGLLAAYWGGRRDLDRYLFDGKYGFIDKTGKVVIDFQFDDAAAFEGELAKVKWLKADQDDPDDLEWGYVNTSGKIVWRQHS